MTKIAVLNGANRGIGLALTRLLIADGYKVWALCRQSSEELKATKAEILTDVDVGSLASAKKAAAAIKDPVDVFVNVAGIMRRETLEDLASEKAYATIAEQFHINAVGALQMTTAMLTKIRDGGKIALITSRMGSIGDNTSGSRYGYRASKAALNMFGKSLAFDLKDRKIAVGILHPGHVQTDMTEGRGNLTANDSAQMLLQRIKDLTLETSGEFFHANGERLPW